jgi:uncharacterized protein (TIGR03435 family)
MVWTTTKKWVASLSLLALVAAAIIVKRSLSPTAHDAYFQLDYQRFQSVPENLLVVRPTHFTDGTGSFITSTQPKAGQYVMRMMGRNVPLDDVMAAAYGCDLPRVVPPLIKAKGNFDYLVTLPGRQRERLQEAVRKKLGYSAHWENRDTDVLLLETITPNPPAFKLSTATSGNVMLGRHKYQFTHMRPTSLLGFLEADFQQPVLDRTGLTNFYDFSVEVTWRESNGPDRQQLAETLSNLGLKLERSTEFVPMLVVEKVH